MRSGDNSFQEFLVLRVTGWIVALLIILITVVFAGIYFELTIHSPLNGIHDASNGSISFGTCLYFSVVTESTLGDGNITPHGLSRACVIIQVSFGLMMVGLVVAKIVGARSFILARMSRMTEGDWVDCLTGTDGETVLGRTWIRGEQSGLCFQGTDFREDGRRAGSFISHSIAISKDKVSFNFQSFDLGQRIDSRETVFYDGQSTLTFSDEKRGRFTTYSITVRDSANRVFSGKGKRLEETPFQERLQERVGSSQEAINELCKFFQEQSQKIL
jgi:hypothetical protein